ncbi:MAG: flavodoxin family protein [Leptolyngbya sp. DLM2.Bin15]|nr:MAG: flavodoxin family protein [Leptolyngbya sp. DLM2.Bin15]
MLTHPSPSSAAIAPAPPRRIVGIVGSYHKHGVVDALVADILAAAQAQGAETQLLYLLDYHIEFCTNCRTCVQSAEGDRGLCPIQDDMSSLLDILDQAQGLVIGAPVNFGNVNALTRRFLERCIVYGYWPWGTLPKVRSRSQAKPVVLVSTSAAPALMARWLTGTLTALKDLAKMLGAKPVGVLWLGGVIDRSTTIPDPIRRRAQRLGQRLAKP